MAKEFKKGRNFKKGKRGGSSPDRERTFKKPFGKSTQKKSFDPNLDLRHGKESYSERKRKNLLDEDRKFQKREANPAKDDKTVDKRESQKGNKPFKKAPKKFERRNDTNNPPQKKFGKPSREKGEKSFGDPFRKKRNTDEDSRGYERVEKKGDNREGQSAPFGNAERRPFKKKFEKKSRGPSYKKITVQDETTSDGLVRLNKYIANAGICSRREADELIRAGAVRVNGKVVTEMGYKVQLDDVINYGGETLRKEKLAYVLLNKPKDFITTLNDPAQRKTVYDLIRNACKERIYPVGRLDRNTTGVLLLTNDGDLTKKLTHPKHGIKKIYMATLDKPLNKPDLDEMANKGVDLDDGHIKPDVINYAGDGSNKKEVGLEIHSGRNRVVRRLFEKFGYTVVKLDRVVFAGLTKKDLPRGNWRLLSEKEVSFLKMLG